LDVSANTRNHQIPLVVKSRLHPPPAQPSVDQL
jgi:hypothetical protein